MWSLVGTALLLFTCKVSAQIAQQCKGSTCYSLNIPQDTASTGKGDIYFQISSPTSNTWTALGQGSAMAGANIFVIYTSSDGKNVTLSPRAGTGHVEPQFSSGPQVTLLSGSGVSNGTMTANIKCGNCDSWSGGSMDFTSGSGSWIWATQSGSALNSDDTNADISQHDDKGSFNFDFTKAKGGSDANPFTNPSATTAGSGGSCTRTSRSSNNGGSSSTSGAAASVSGYGLFDGSVSLPSATAGFPTSSPSGAYPTGWKRDTDDDDDDDCNDGSDSEGDSSRNEPDREFLENLKRTGAIIKAHGIMASIAWVILFPIGAIIIRVLSFPRLIWLHALLQMFAYIMYIAATGLGLWIAINGKFLYNNNDHKNAHPIIGLVIFSLVFFQPILGMAHHSAFRKHGRRTAWSHAHLWLGRILITLAMINGGLGLLLAANATRGQNIAYGVVAGIVWIVYVASIVAGEARRARQSRGLERVGGLSRSPVRKEETTVTEEAG